MAPSEVKLRPLISSIQGSTKRLVGRDPLNSLENSAGMHDSMRKTAKLRRLATIRPASISSHRSVSLQNGIVSPHEQNFRNLVETGGFYILRTSRAGTVLYVSSPLCDVLGFPIGEFQTNSYLYRSLIHPDDIEQRDQTFAHRLTTASLPVEVEYRILCRDGTYRWMFERQTKSAVTEDSQDASLKVDYLDSIIFDIQDRKLLESELRHSQRMDMVGQLASGVAHDFNNYLTAIIGQLRLSLLEVARDSITHERLLATEQAALRCADMTKQLLSLAHRDQTAKKAVSIAQLVASTASLCAHLLPTSICLSLEHSDESLKVDADEGQLQQVLMNLIINARDAITDVGSIALSAKTIEVANGDPIKAIPIGKYVQILVRDSGSGIAPQHLAHIFEPFFTTKSAGHGTGLGLSLVYSIVRNHGGCISVKSRVGKTGDQASDSESGTEFCLLLPVGTLELPDAQTFNAPEQFGDDSDNIAGRTPVREVLVVDDEPLVRSVIKASLLGSGFSVVEVCDGAAALAILSQTSARFALAIIDQSMPGMSGRELVSKIRSSGNRTPLLLTTGLPSFDGAPTNPEDIHEIIIKPFDPVDLVSAAFRLCKRN